MTDRHEEISRAAYDLWQRRGGAHGSAEEDWSNAERSLADPGDGSVDAASESTIDGDRHREVTVEVDDLSSAK